jgi:NAD(P)-dependent dehydrogenase (short-subunit alcohol dehydrogenase family)
MPQSSNDGVANQARNLPLLATREICSGKTYIVTGANVGLGFEAAKHLAVLGAGRVILAVRTPSKGETAKAAIDAAAGTAGTDVVQVWPLDLEKYDSVRAFVKKAAAELERIDAVIENAAVALATREMAEGHVKPVTVNVLSTFLMAVLLVPVMREKAKKVGGTTPNIAIVASRAGFEDKCHADWDGIKEDPIRGMDAEEMEPVST